MKKILIPIAIITVFFAFACDKEDLTPFENLTSHVWVADSLLANGVDAGGELFAAWESQCGDRVDVDAAWL